MILSLGVKSSSGFIIFDGAETPKYVASNATDVKELIEILVDIVQLIATTLTSVDGVTNTPGTATAGVTQIQTKKALLNTKKDQLK